jgi:hypothetical protein
MGIAKGNGPLPAGGKNPTQKTKQKTRPDHSERAFLS